RARREQHRRAGRVHRAAQDHVGHRLSAPGRLLPGRAADAPRAARAAVLRGTASGARRRRPRLLRPELTHRASSMSRRVAEIRLATPADGAQLSAIYAPLVRDTAITFEVDPPDAAEMSRRVAESLPAFPWLVVEAGGEVLGYVYASKHRERAAYLWSVDTTVYTHARVRR